VGEEAWHKAGFTASSSLYEDLDDPYSPEWMQGVFSEVQLRDAERLSVRRVMSSSCSQPSPTKE
jgi:hypothetical protein